MNGDYLLLLLFIFCLALSAFFSSSEVALISITRAKVRTLINEGKNGSEALSELKEKPSRFLISILIGNNIVNIAARIEKTLGNMEFPFKMHRKCLMTHFIYLCLMNGSITLRKGGLQSA